MSFPQPHEILDSAGNYLYACRPCGKKTNLHWYNGTSCPVCDNPECEAALDLEWKLAYENDVPLSPYE